MARDFHALGIRTHLIQVDQNTVYTDCETPRDEVDACPSVGWIRDFDDAASILYPTFSRTSGENFGQVRDPTLQRLMNAALDTTSASASARAWAKADDRIVEQAETVPEIFNIQANVFSADVHWVGDLWNIGAVDFAYTGLN